LAAYFTQCDIGYKLGGIGWPPFNPRCLQSEGASKQVSGSSILWLLCNSTTGQHQYVTAMQ